MEGRRRKKTGINAVLLVFLVLKIAQSGMCN